MKARLGYCGLFLLLLFPESLRRRSSLLSPRPFALPPLAPR